MLVAEIIAGEIGRAIGLRVPQMRAVTLDAFTANGDRTWSNPNLLVWHGQTWVIDHGPPGRQTA